MSRPPSVDDQLEEKVETYRQSLRQKMGLEQDEVQHFKRPYERPFPLVEQATTTIVYCGLTSTHEEIVLGVLEKLGYKAQRLPIPDYEALPSARNSATAPSATLPITPWATS